MNSIAAQGNLATAYLRWE